MKIIKCKQIDKTMLNNDWKFKKSRVISLGEAKKMILAFKKMKIQDDKNVLIFSDGLTWFRKAGEQYEYYQYGSD